MAELSNRPLLGVGPDTERWVPNPALLSRLEKAVDAGLNTLVLGAPGSGKTTLLHMLERRHDNRDQPVAFVSGGVATNVEELLELIHAQVFYALGEQSGPLVRLPSSPDSEAGRLLDRVRALRASRGALILLDDLPSAEVGHVLFGRLRDELWQLPHQWIVAARERWKSALTRPPADAFFETQLALPALTPSQVREMLWRRGVDVDAMGDDAVHELASASQGNPLALLQLARHALLSPSSAGNRLAKVVERQQKAAALGRAASMLVAELEARGAVSASDQDLLDSLGWTRSRATQVLRQLEDAGIARAYEDAAGRRRLYELVGDEP